jgi:hypothetical protein
MNFMTMRDSMDRLFEDRWVSPGNWLTWSSLGGNYLPIDVYETSDDTSSVRSSPEPGQTASTSSFREAS